MNRLIKFGTAFIFLISCRPLQSETLTLSQYLDQVKNSHLGFQAAQIRSKSFELESKVGTLALSPYLFGSALWADDSRPQMNIPASGDQTKQKAYGLGLSKLFSIGTQTKASYQLNRTQIVGSSPTYIPEPDYYQGSLNFEIAQPLWRNFFGSETRAMIVATEAEKLETSFNERYRMKQLLSMAEAAYWRAYAAQRALKVRESSLERAQKLSDWAKSRADLHLADRSDFLQASAAYKNRALELRAANEDFESASISFNSLRGNETPEILESLVNLSADELAKIEPPTRASLRDDTYAAEQRKRQAESASQFSLEKSRPTLELTGSLSLAGRDPKLSRASSDSFANDNSTFAVGLNLNAPLDFWKAKAISDGAKASQRAAELDYQRKVFEQEREWADLTHQFQAKKEELQLARELEKIQNEKLALEQDRLKKGRTTTFQVLTFEQDFDSARLNLILIESQLLSLRAQMKTFGEGVQE